LTRKTERQGITRCKTNAGARRTKTASCFFQISGDWTTKEHEIRTGLTAQRYGQAEKTHADNILQTENKIVNLQERK
jgi:hypothetical protein